MLGIEPKIAPCKANGLALVLSLCPPFASCTDFSDWRGSFQLECRSDLFFCWAGFLPLSELVCLRRPGGKGCDSNEISLRLLFRLPTTPPLSLSRIRGTVAFLDSTVAVWLVDGRKSVLSSPLPS